MVPHLALSTPWEYSSSCSVNDSDARCSATNSCDPFD